MGVIRVVHNGNYTTMANYHLRDKSLSLRAIGLMSKMLSLPDDWDYTVAGLAAICKEGREAVRTVLQELEGSGYLVRQQSRAGGKFHGYDYTLFENPDQAADFDRCPETWATVPPLPEKPVTENPVTENPPQLSKDKPSKELPTPKPPKGARVPKEKAVCEWEPEMFERFWKLYPRGEDKAKARYEWDKLRPDSKLMREMSAALKRQLKTDEWQRNVGIPYACRWLSNRRWEAAEKLPPLPDEHPQREEASTWI